MANSQAFSTQATNGSEYAYGYGYAPSSPSISSICHLFFFVPREYNISPRHGSLHANNFLSGRSYGTKDENKVPLNQELNVKALSTQRLEDFFANEDFKSSSPASWGQISISSATKNMQAQIQAFDQAFHGNDNKHMSCK